MAIAREVTDPLEIDDDLERHADEPEIRSDRLPGRQDLQRELVDGNLVAIDLVVFREHVARDVVGAFGERRQRVSEPFAENVQFMLECLASSRDHCGHGYVPRAPCAAGNIASGLVDLTTKEAAERLLVVRGCGRKTLREIAVAVANEPGKQLDGFDQAMRGHGTKPTITTGAAAQALGVDADVFLGLAWKIGLRPKRGPDGRQWSEWDVFSVRRFVRTKAGSG